MKRLAESFNAMVFARHFKYSGYDSTLSSVARAVTDSNGLRESFDIVMPCVNYPRQCYSARHCGFCPAIADY
jgi:hypothetical protein